MGWAGRCIDLMLLIGGAHFLATNVSASEDPNSVFCYSNPCQNNGTCVNLLRPGSDRSLSVCQGESCYKLITQEMTWEEATIQCGMMGASLVSMETVRERNFFQNAIEEKRLYRTHTSPDNPGGFWSSGNDLRTEGHWVWGATGNTVTTWFPPYPSGPTENCLMLNTDLTALARVRWEAAPCGKRLYYACEMSVEALYQERTFQCLCAGGYSGEFCEHTSDLQIEYVCHDAALDLTCDRGKHLNIVQATFHLAAAPANSLCPDPTGVTPTDNCVLPSSLSTYLYRQVLQPRCEGQESCYVNITEEVLRIYDQCPSSHKYAQVEYRCRDTYTVHTETCETYVADLSCEKPLGLPYIRIDVAVYGRLRPSSSCSESTLRTGDQPVTNCRAVTTLDIAASGCNGYSTCNIIASHDVFQDPCEGVFKYLDISYQCVANISDATAAYPLTYGIATLSPPVFCTALNHSGVQWRTIKEGHTDTQRCPNGQDGLAFWHCDSGIPVRWSLSGPDLTQCISPWVNDIYQQIDDGSISANLLAETVLNNTVASGAAQFRDIQKSVSLMDDLVMLQDVQLQGLGEEERESTVQTFGATLLGFGSNLLDSDKQSTWASVILDGDSSSTPSAAATPTTVTENLENTGFLVARYLKTNTTTLTINSANILMTVETVALNNTGKSLHFQDSRKNEEGGSDLRHTIELPPSATQTKGEVSMHDDPVQVVFLVYETLGEYLTDVSLEDMQDLSSASNDSDYDSSNETERSIPQLNSAVLSASARKLNQDVKTFDNGEEVLLTIKHAKTNITGNVSCVFWNSSKSLGKSGAWSDKGCRLVSSNQTYSVCACNHLTNFAILMDVTGTHRNIDPVHDEILTALTFIGCSVSIVSLLLSLFAFTFFKNIWSLRVTIHRNLCLMLLLANALFIAGVDKTQIKILCSMIAALLHYSFLSAFVWMSLEAVQFYIMLVHVFSTHSTRWPYYLAGYGIPAIVVGVSAGINPSGYGTDRYCWLSTDDYFIWSFMGPVAGIIAVNVVLLVVSLRIAYNSRSSINKGVTQNDIRPWIKGATTLLFLLGITWGVGFFFINQQSLVVAYIFTVLNSLQGLFIFLFYCLGNERVNSELRKFLNQQKWLPSCIRDRYGKKTASNHSWSQKGTTASRRQTCHPEAYHKRGSSDGSAMNSLTEVTHAEGTHTGGHRHCTNPVIDVQLVDRGGDEGGTNLGYDADSMADSYSTNVAELGTNVAELGTNVADETQGGSSWLHNNAMNNFIASNKTEGVDQYPKVDYD